GRPSPGLPSAHRGPGGHARPATAEAVGPGPGGGGRMRRELLALGASIAVIAGACSSGGTPAPSSGGPAGSAVAPSEAASEGASQTAESAAPSFDSSAVSGTVKLAGWQSSDAEKKALQ